MKLNFLNVLKKKSTQDEIAEQIIALEMKKTQCEKTRDEAKNACKELRGQAMCEERVNPDAIRAADKTYDAASLDLEIITESLEELHKSLAVVFKTYIDEGFAKIIEDRRKLEANREILMHEANRMKGRLFGLMIGICGHPEIARRQLEAPLSFSPFNDSPLYAEFHSEKERALNELSKPTPGEIENDIQSRQFELNNLKVEDGCNRVLNKYRETIVAVAD